MALKKCSECGKMISPSANTCPQCGAHQNNILKLFALGLLLCLLGWILMDISHFASFFFGK